MLWTADSIILLGMYFHSSLYHGMDSFGWYLMIVHFLYSVRLQLLVKVCWFMPLRSSKASVLGGEAWVVDGEHLKKLFVTNYIHTPQYFVYINIHTVYMHGIVTKLIFNTYSAPRPALGFFFSCSLFKITQYTIYCVTII